MDTKPSGRIEIIDVLRGFALLGILLVHFSGEFAGWSSVYSSPVNAASLPTSSADSITNFLLNLFLTNKARSLFAFLFGVGFFYQLDKANRNGYRIEKKFARRMLALLLIGALHAYLIWAGDILRFYAVCGLALLLVYKWKPRKLFIVAVICAILIPAISVSFRYYFPFSMLTNEMKVQMYKGLAGEEYTSFFRANLLRDVATNWDPYAVCFYFFPVFGNFIFGFLAAQINLFHRLTVNKKLLYRCLFASFLIGFFASNSFVRLAAKPFGATESDIPITFRSVLSLPGSLSNEAMAFFWLCFIIYLYRIPFFTSKLATFAFAGRITLTNYITQSLFGILFFYGLGLGYISHYGSAIALVIGLAYFIVQLWYSRLWLRYFSAGPIEYLWRSLVERKWKQLRRTPAEVAVV